jgi:polyisoprenyl-phosphate glycosyltransferase
MSKIKILVPVYNDWKSVFKLLENIDLQINDLNHEFSILIVNDCSTDERPTNNFNFKNLKSVIMRMKIMIISYQWMVMVKINQKN